MRSSGLDRSLRRRSGGQRSTGNGFIFIPVLRFSPVSIIQQMFHTPCVHNQRYITLATDNIVKHRTETTSLTKARINHEQIWQEIHWKWTILKTDTKLG